MALTTTTLSAAVAVGDTSITPTATTGFAAGSVIRCDQELMLVGWGYVAGASPVAVIRGQQGTIAQAHVSGANVTVGVASDWASSQAPQTVPQYPIAGRARTLTSYSAAGAITLPVAGSDAVAVLNGTNALAMTITAPGKDLDGSIIYIVSNGKAAHTVDVDGTVGIGDAGGSYDIATFSSSGRNALVLMAVNAMWVLLSRVSGTDTNIVPAIA